MIILDIDKLKHLLLPTVPVKGKKKKGPKLILAISEDEEYVYSILQIENKDLVVFTGCYRIADYLEFLFQGEGDYIVVAPDYPKEGRKTKYFVDSNPAREFLLQFQKEWH